MRFVVLTVVKIHIEVFWVVMPCSVAVGYQCFRGPHCFHLQGEVSGNGKKGIHKWVWGTGGWQSLLSNSRKGWSGSQWY